MRTLVLAITLLGCITNLFADDIYLYTDKNGNSVYTNKPVKNAKKVKLPPISVYSSPMTKSDFAASGYTQPNGAKITKIYTKAVTPTYGNEIGRQQILAEELSREKQALNDSQQALTTAKQTKLASEMNQPEQYQARIQSLQDAVTEHQKNISTLSKQLGVNN